MIIHDSLDHIPPLPESIALTIGTFDGVHLGHQYLLSELKKQGTPLVITFSNHPAEILHPHQVPTPILTLSDKLQLFQQFEVALVIVLPFTAELAQMPYDLLLTKIPFSILVAGEDIRVGAQGAGNRDTLSKLGFPTLFLPKLKLVSERQMSKNFCNQTLDTVISSRLIRELIQNKQYSQAQQLLGHHKGLPWLDSRVES